MTRTPRLFLIASSAAFVLLVGGFATGCGHPPRDPAEVAAFVNDRVDDTLDDLSATDAQRTQVHAIVNRLLASVQAARQDGPKLHEVLMTEWQNATPDAARLHALVDERMDALRALAHQAVDEGVALHALLTPDQRAKLEKKVLRLHRFHP
jgi:Spy/CpxP family protein refolding chaperone